MSCGECGSGNVSSMETASELGTSLEYTPVKVVSRKNGGERNHTEVARICQDCGVVTNSLIKVGKVEKVRNRHDVISQVARKIINEPEHAEILSKMRKWIKPKENFKGILDFGVPESVDLILMEFIGEYPDLEKYLR